jgi:hypothetical protein
MNAISAVYFVIMPWQVQSDSQSLDYRYLNNRIAFTITMTLLNW